MNLQEKWQVEVAGKVYEAEFGELEKWVYEGSLLPADLVRRGSLRWIEASKVPALHKFFNAKDQGRVSPPVMTTTQAGPMDHFLAPGQDSSSETFNLQTKLQAEQNNFSEFRGFSKSLENFKYEEPPPVGQPVETAGGVCCLHPEAPAFYYCATCTNSFCKACPKSYGGDVKICPACGAMCKTLKESQEKLRQHSRHRAALGEGFGFGDFARALAYPFKFKTSLFFGALFFVFFSVGQGAAAFGGVMAFAALICYLGTNMLSFGILANMLDNFSKGITDADFMPRFDDFSIWDDVIHPFLLSIGVYLVSFGLFFAILAGSLWISYSAATEAENQAMTQKISQFKNPEPLPPPATNTPVEPMTAESVDQAHQAQAAKVQTLMKEIQEQGQQIAAPAAEARPALSFDSIIKSLSAMSLPLILALGVTLLWGFFYYPAASAVAGYTRSFAATMNISVGLDTIKRLGADYLKILAMSLALSLLTGAALAGLAPVFKPFELPMMGNLPLSAVGGILSLYTAIVFACLMGAAIYKNASRLALDKG